MFKSTIEIYTEYDPSEVELIDLAQEATDGDAICVIQKQEPVELADLPGEARQFFEGIR